jgi:hypothetical protein
VPHRDPADAGATRAAGGAFQLDVEAEQGGTSRLGGVRRQQLMHPGYFMANRGPSYTPAPPEALIDASEELPGFAGGLKRTVGFGFLLLICCSLAAPAPSRHPAMQGAVAAPCNRTHVQC